MWVSQEHLSCVCENLLCISRINWICLITIIIMCYRSIETSAAICSIVCENLLGFLDLLCAACPSGTINCSLFLYYSFFFGNNISVTPAVLALGLSGGRRKERGHDRCCAPRCRRDLARSGSGRGAIPQKTAGCGERGCK